MQTFPDNFAVRSLGTYLTFPTREEADAFALELAGRVATVQVLERKWSVVTMHAKESDK